MNASPFDIAANMRLEQIGKREAILRSSLAVVPRLVDIFVSYAAEDRERIAPLVDAFKDQGWDVWWDRSLIAGPAFTEEIQENLDAAKCVVVAWSEHSVASGWCRDEAAEGLERGCLVPLRIDDVRPPLGFRSSHTAALLNWPRERGELDQLLSGVEAVLSGPDRRRSKSDAGVPKLSSDTSIAVLPFRNLGGDPDEAYFCDGLVDDLITELSSVPQLLVISRVASFAYRDGQDDLQSIGRALNARYVLQGSIRRSSGRMRVTAGLVEAVTGRSLWSRRFDRQMADLFAVQDELTREIVIALDIELISGDKGQIRRGRVREPETAELVYRGMFEYFKFERTSMPLAQHYFERVISVEPDSSVGYTWLVQVHAFSLVAGWDTPETALPRIRDYSNRCLALDGNNPDALVGDAIFKALTGDLEGALVSSDQGVSVMPNHDEAWFYRGWALMLAGDHVQAITSIHRAMRLCPVMSSIKLGVLGTAYRNAGRYQDAIDTFEASLRQNPDFGVFAHSQLAVAFALMGDHERAEHAVAKTLALDPTYTVKRFITPNLYRDPEVMQRSARILSAAGLPEG